MCLDPLHNKKLAVENSGCSDCLALLGLRVKGRVLAHLGIIFLAFDLSPTGWRLLLKDMFTAETFFSLLDIMLRNLILLKDTVTFICFIYVFY